MNTNLGKKLFFDLAELTLLISFLRTFESRPFMYNYRNWIFTSLCFIWHLLSPNWSISRGAVRLLTFGRIRNRRHFPSLTAILPFSNILKRLTAPRIINQFGRKRCQKKHKYVRYQLQ